MFLEEVSRGSGTVLRDAVRLSARVRYDDSRRAEESFWFEVPEELEDELSASGNPWLLALLHVAMSLGEPLRLRLPVDPVLYRNVEEIGRLWARWHPHLDPVPIHVDRFEAVKPGAARTDATFFTAGVDSWFNVLHREDTLRRLALPNETLPEELIYVVGLEVTLEQADVWRPRTERLRRLAEAMGVELRVVATNLRGSGPRREYDYASVWHGAGLASAALLLELRYHDVRLAASQDYLHAIPWGSHPALDPLMSTSATRFVHYGAGFTRVEKTRFVAQNDLALRALHVCPAPLREGNCSECHKCLRTMLTLELDGRLERSDAFGRSAAEVMALFPWLRLRAAAERPLIEELLEACRDAGRADAAEAVGACLRRNRRLDRWDAVLGSVARLPALRRPATSLRKKLARRARKRLAREVRRRDERRGRPALGR